MNQENPLEKLENKTKKISLPGWTKISGSFKFSGYEGLIHTKTCL